MTWLIDIRQPLSSVIVNVGKLLLNEVGMVVMCMEARPRLDNMGSLAIATPAIATAKCPNF